MLELKPTMLARLVILKFLNSVLACQYYMGSTTSKNKFLGMPRIEPRTAGWEAKIIPLCFVVTLKFVGEISNVVLPITIESLAWQVTRINLKIWIIVNGSPDETIRTWQRLDPLLDGDRRSTSLSDVESRRFDAEKRRQTSVGDFGFGVRCFCRRPLNALSLSK